MFDEIELLKEIGKEASPLEGARERARQKLLVAIREAQPESSAPRHRRRWLAGVGAVAALLLIALGLSLMLPRQSGGPAPSAARVLNDAADVAASRPASSIGATQFAYTKTSGLFDRSAVSVDQSISYTVLVPETREEWVSPDGSGRLLQTAGTPEFPRDADRAAWIDAGKPSLGGNQQTDQSYGPGGLPFYDFSNLPTEPSALLSALRERGLIQGSYGTQATLNAFGQLLAQPSAPPETRAALYRAASELSGVHLFGPLSDHAGRSGVAVGATGNGTRTELIIDPQTSQLLERQTVNLETGSVTYETFLSSGIVDSRSQVP